MEGCRQGERGEEQGEGGREVGNKGRNGGKKKKGKERKKRGEGRRENIENKMQAGDIQYGSKLRTKIPSEEIIGMRRTCDVTSRVTGIGTCFVFKTF